MSSAFTSHDGPEGEHAAAAGDHEGITVSADSLLTLLGDENTRRVLETIAEEPRGGREIAELLSLSRPTVYRRLNDLTDAGLVETTLAVCPDGHHHKQYSALVETASVELTADGLTATIQHTDSTDGEESPPEDWSVADD